VAVLARLYDFTPSTTIVSAQVDAELQQLVDVLTGVKVNGKHTLRYNASDAATLTLDNTGSGDIASFAVGGVEKALVNAAGQFESVLATGTAPLVVASETMVENLNAEFLGGLTAADFLDGDDSITITGDDPFIDLVHSTAATDDARIVNDSAVLKIRNQTDDTTIFSIDLNTGLATFTGKVAGANATEDGQFVTKQQLALTEHFVQVGAFYDGAPAVGQFGYWLPVSPYWQLDLRLGTHLICAMTGGSGTTTFELRHYAANLLSHDVILEMSITGAVAGVEGVYDSGGVSLAGYSEGFFVWVCTAVGTHQNISLGTEILFTIV
jgi:hypothetical protein